MPGGGRFETGPYARGGGDGIGGVWSAGGRGLPGVWFDRLTRDAGCGRVVGCCWVPAPFGRLRAGLTPGWRGRKTGGSETAALGGIGMGRLGAFSLAGCQGWLGSVGVEHGAGSRPGTPGWRRKRKTGGSETAPLRKIRTGWRDGGGCCIRGCGSTRASGGLRPGRFDRLRTGSPRTVSRVASTGRGRFETGPYARSGWNGGIGGVWSAGGGGLPGMWFDRLTRDAGCGRVVGWCWVPAPFGRLRAGLTPGWRGKKTGGSGLGAGRGGSTRPSVDSGSAHHERGGAADAGCAEDGRVGDRAPTQDRDADAGMAGGRG